MLMNNITLKRLFMLICLNQHPINKTSTATAYGALLTLPAMLADAGPSTLLAFAALPAMLADAGPSTLLASAALPAMLADTGPSTSLAPDALPAVRAALPFL